MTLTFTDGDDEYKLNVDMENVKQKSNNQYDLEVLPADFRYYVDIEERKPEIDVAQAYFYTANNSKSFADLTELLDSTGDFEVDFSVGGTTVKLHGADSQTVKCPTWDAVPVDYGLNVYRLTISLEVV